MSLKQTQQSKNEIAEKLDATRWSIDFNWQQIETFAKYLNSYSALSGDVIFEQHSSDRTMGIVVKGTLDIVRTEEDGSSTNLASIHQSQSFGEMALIDGEQRSAKIIANGDVELLFLDQEQLFKIVDDSPALAFKILWTLSQMLSQRLRKTSHHLVEQLKS